MKKFILATILALTCLALPGLAQVSGTNYSIFPNVSYPQQSFTATGTFTQAINGVSAGVLTVKGTWTNFTMLLQGTNDNATFSNLTVVPLAGGSPVTTINANGVYLVNLAALSQVKFNVTGSSPTGTFTVKLTGSAAQGPEIPLYPLSADPCQDRNAVKQSAVVSVAATTAAIIPLAAGKNTYICEFQGTESGTAGAFQLKAGTQTTNPCDTGTVNLTTAQTPATTVQQFFGWGGTTFGPPQIPIANQVCLTVASATFSGSITFVQQ